jgi:holo-[acyl-carrier protein] synthase
MQLRYIDKNGMEIIRVDKIDSDKNAYLTPKDKLQNKSNRDYFIAVSSMNEVKTWHSKFLSDEEIELVSNYKTASGFWAAKEALSKALGVGIGKECSFQDIKIIKTQKGAPKIELSQKLINNFNISDTSLSITHDGDYAIAVVAIETN